MFPWDIPQPWYPFIWGWKGMPEVCSKLYVERTLRIFDHTKKTIKSGHSQMPRDTGISIYLTTCPKIQAIHVGKYTYHSFPGSSKTPLSLKRSVSVSRKNPMDVFSPWIWPKKHRTLFRRLQKRWNKNVRRKEWEASFQQTQNRDTHINQPNPTQPKQPTQPNPNNQPNPTQPNPTQPNPTQPNPTQPTNSTINHIIFPRSCHHPSTRRFSPRLTDGWRCGLTNRTESGVSVGGWWWF